MSSEHKFIGAAFTAMLCVVLGAGALNWVVDPHDYFGKNWPALYVDNDRYAKRSLVKRYEHDSLLLGSSKIAAINPDDIKSGRYFNAGMVSAVPEEMLFFLQDHSDGIKRVVLGFDFFMMNEGVNSFRDTRQLDPQAISSWYVYLFSATITEASLETIVKYLRGVPPIVQKNGQRDQSRRQILDSAFDSPAYEKVIFQVRNRVFGKFSYSERRLQVMKEIKAYLDARGIEYIVLINPEHPEIRKLIEDLSLGGLQRRFVREVGSVFPGVVNLYSSEWSREENFYWTDPWHYRPEIGAAFLNRILEGSR